MGLHRSLMAGAGSFDQSVVVANRKHQTLNMVLALALKAELNGYVVSSNAHTISFPRLKLIKSG